MSVAVTCDRCQIVEHGENNKPRSIRRVTINMLSKSNPIRDWDLCPVCFADLLSFVHGVGDEMRVEVEGAPA